MEQLIIARQMNGYDVGGALPYDSGCEAMENLRIGAAGTPEICKRPAGMGEIERKPVACDRRRGRSYILTQEDDGLLWLEGYVDENQTYHPLASPIGRITQTILTGAPSGDFLTLLSEQGELFYLLWSESYGSYTLLGKMPELPSFNVKADVAVDFYSSMPEVSFKGGIADLRGELDSESRKRVSDALITAYQDGVNAVHAAGYWIEPVTVRVALRLWDGTVAQVSDARLVNPPGDRPSTERIMLTPVWDSTRNIFTGVAGHDLHLSGYRFAVEMADSIPLEWQNIISGIEIWVGREPASLENGKECGLSEYHDSTGNYLTALLPARSGGEIDAEALAAPCGLLLTGLGSLPSEKLSYADGLVYDSEVLAYTPASLSREAVAAVLGYGDFLHIACGSTVRTMRRGNPFVEADRTEGVGGSVDGIRAQLSGGGAFTRQYLYLSTHRGIAALTYKPDGTHTNCRMLSQECVASGALFLSTPQGVYAVSHTGSLLRLSDARCEQILRGMSGACVLVWSNLYGELWVCGEKGAMVLTDTARRAGFHSSLTLHSRLDSLSPALAVEKELSGIYSVVSLDAEGTESCGTALWRGKIECERNPRPGTVVGISVEGTDIDMRVRLEHNGLRPGCNGAHRWCVMDVSLRSPSDFSDFIPCVVPRGMSVRQGECVAEVSGKFKHIKKLRVYES